MLRIPGQLANDLCDRGLGLTRRDLLRVGGSSLLGLSLAQMSRMQQARANTNVGRGHRRRSRLEQGQERHHGLPAGRAEPPRPVGSQGQRARQRAQRLQADPHQAARRQFTELLPKLAQVNDKMTLIRSMSYTPVGLFNHTAAIYQMLTGYTTDKVSPSGQLEPPSPKDFPNFGSNIIRLKPPTVPMLPFVMMPRPLQESNVVGKGGTAGFLGRAYDPYYLYPSGDDMDMDKMDRITVDDLQLRPEVSSARLERRARLRDLINEGMPDIDKAVAKYDLDEYYDKALGLVISGRARDAFDLKQETDAMRDRYGRNTFGQSCLLARRLIEAGTRVVEVNWPKVANSDNHSWDVHTGPVGPHEEAIGPDARRRPVGADRRPGRARPAARRRWSLAVGEFGRSPQRGVSTSGNANSDDGRDHWPYCYTACIAGAGIKRGFVYGKSDETASAPLENPVHPIELLATIYHAVGINPATIVYNHLNQPRELVKAEVVTKLFA